MASADTDADARGVRGRAARLGTCGCFVAHGPSRLPAPAGGDARPCAVGAADPRAAAAAAWRAAAAAEIGEDTNRKG
jgi:hypothetical protein